MDKVNCVILNKFAKKDTERLPLAGFLKLRQLKSQSYLKQLIFNIVCESTPETYDFHTLNKYIFNI